MQRGTLDQYFGKCYNLDDAVDMGPRLGGHPIAQDGGIAPLEEDAHPAPKVGDGFPFLLPGGLGGLIVQMGVSPIGGSPNGGSPNGGSPIGSSPIGGSPNGDSPIGGSPSPIGGSPNGGSPIGG